MSSVLFDVPGPRARARTRIYTIVSAVVLLALLAGAVWKLYDAGQLTYEKWEVFLTPRYIVIILVDGVLVTLQMAFFSVIFAVVFGLAFGLGKLSEHRWVRWPAWLVVEFFRAVPVLILMIFVFYLFSVGGGPLSTFWCVVVALTLYNGSVLAEVFRAGVLSVPQGQEEAAYAIGMRRTQVLWIVQLPQAVKVMLPALISQCVVALKDTSLGYYIVAPGLTAVNRSIYLEFQNQVPAAFVVAALYISMCLALSWIATRVQKRLVGETSPLDLTRVGNLDGGQNAGGAI